MMNVLNVLYDLYQGGVEHLAITVSNEMVQQGHNAFFCIISGEYDATLIERLDSRVHLRILKKEKKARKLGYLKQLIAFIKKNHIEVLHVHQGTIMNFYLLVKVFCPNVKIFYTVHDTYIFTDLPRRDQVIAKLICNKIIAISDAVVDNITSTGVERNKIERVYNGVDFTEFRKLNTKVFDKDRIVIVNVARFIPSKKGQDVLIRAASQLKESGYCIQVLFAGGMLNPNDSAMSEMQKLAQELGVSDYVSFLGNVSNIAQLLENVDIFCIPSRYEGFGISAVEAMSVGIPCVASNVVGLNEVVNDEILGRVFEAGNDTELAKQLIYVIEHYDEYVPEAIRDNVLKRFSIQKMVSKLIEIYQL
ncbi:glycosyltransferase family 4 protein [Pseudobacteroides cellulosolvens]|uniref:Glycosyl transferase group 1 n=1 Tax=Pseudobacteroides cellulosolvens ATCC 35603 = DSM 2933 TaxID=398512 RepID=A0A0L6JLE2_9FIRM|nr:glycosyltransferase family 4 protein [Pseudobacteroides cellulosolvens]KNY26573.1 glycosyl transferase group 1 [Pseudobacteroides cellulosolvens ATCC 35603 = DSM 2933]